MDNTLMIVLVVTVSSYIGFGILFFYCIKSTTVSPLEQFKLLRDVTSAVSLFINKQYPQEHPENKKHLMRQLIAKMLKERLKGPVTLDVLLTTHQSDTDARLVAAEVPTQQVPTYQQPAQQTPPEGMRQRSILRKTGGLLPL